MDEQQMENVEKAAENAVNPEKGGFFYRFMHAVKGGPDNALYYTREALSWVLVFVVAFLVAIFINMYIFRMSDVSGNSMLQSYTDGERVYLSKLPVIFNGLDRGDVIVFDHTKKCNTFFEDFAESVKFNKITQLFMTSSQKASNTHQFYIKRIIGVAGDVITVTDGVLYLNGKALTNESYVNPNETPDYSAWEGCSWTVGEGEYFVMGDNRNHSTDGRTLGVIPKGCILGKVIGGHKDVVTE